MKVIVPSANPVTLKKLLLDANYIYSSLPNNGVAVLLKNAGANSIHIDVGAYKMDGNTVDGVAQFIDKSTQTYDESDSMLYLDKNESFSFGPNTTFPSFSSADLDGVVLQADGADTDLLVLIVS